MRCLGSLLLVLLAGAAGAGEALRLRQEYNQVAAALDSLVRQRGSEELERLAETAPQNLVPAGMEAVLLLWADDETEVWLNGQRVGQTRLTPTRIAIPSLYLRERNLLQVHAWDTDRVESGLMAGLYLEDAQGRLRPVLVTQEQGWRTRAGPAREVYYIHSQPDIPGARIIWGEQLYGEVWLEGEFAGGSLRRAEAARPLSGPAGQVQEQPMADHQLLTRLVGLEARRQELTRLLEEHQGRAEYPLWPGRRGLGLSLTLGRAAPLAEHHSAPTAQRLHQWAQALPSVQQELFFPEARPLKGAPTPAQTQPGSREGRTDRRAEYQPPPERGPNARIGQAPPGAGRISGGAPAPWNLWALCAGLVVYVGVAGLRWWRLFTSREWSTSR